MILKGGVHEWGDPLSRPGKALFLVGNWPPCCCAPIKLFFADRIVVYLYKDTSHDESPHLNLIISQNLITFRG